MSDDDPAVPKPEEPTVAAAAPAQSDAEVNGDAAGAPTGHDRRDEGHRRPTGWIVLCGLLAVAVVGLAVWALSAQSNADDSNAKLTAATAAAATAKTSETPTPTPTAAATAAPAAPPDAATQQAVDEPTAAGRATNENLASIEQDLQKASADADAARKAKADASTGLEKAKADVAEFKANAQVATACLRGVLEAVKTAFSSGGAQAALDQAKALAG